MKKLTTISLFIFGVIITAILTAGLVFYQNRKDSNVANTTGVGSKVLNTMNSLESSGKSITLDMVEIKKHNTQSDCWYLISGKVYDITNFFGSHPAGDSAMAPMCGKDATVAYNTQDPYATTTNRTRSAHSSSAVAMLNDYYIGDLNQVINQQKITETKNTKVAPSVTKGNVDDYDEDEEDDD